MDQIQLSLNGRTSTSQHHGRTQLLSTMVGPQILNAMVGTRLNLFQNHPNSQPISSGHDVFYTQPHLLSGVYYDNGDCHIFCTRA